MQGRTVGLSAHKIQGLPFWAALNPKLSKRNYESSLTYTSIEVSPWPHDEWITALTGQGRVAPSHCLAKGLMRHDRIYVQYVCYEWNLFSYELPRSLSLPHYAPSYTLTLICHRVHSVWCLTYGNHTHKLYSSALQDNLQLEHVLCIALCDSPMQMIKISMSDLCDLFN